MSIWEMIAIAKAGSGGGGSPVFHFKGSVATKNDLPATSEEGDTYLVEAENSYFAWDGDSWTDIGQMLTMDDVAELFDQLEDAGDAQVTRITEKGAEVIASIPEDYTELSNEVSSVKSAFKHDSAPKNKRRRTVIRPSPLQRISSNLPAGNHIAHRSCRLCLC